MTLRINQISGRTPCLLVAVTASTVMMSFHPAAGQSFLGLGRLPGAPNSYAISVSGDGQVVVGYSGDTPANSRAFKWTADQGMVELEPLPGHTLSYALGASHDGSVIVGFSASVFGGPNQDWRAVRWTNAGVLALGSIPPNAVSIAQDVSGDGTVIVGGSGINEFRWTEALGMHRLSGVACGNVVHAYAVSSDGTVITGAVNCAVAGCVGPVGHAFSWSEQAGFSDLGIVSGYCFMEGRGVSQGGEVVVGYSVPAGASFRWSATTGMRALSMFGANDVSADGNVIVGGGVWTPAWGLVDLNTLLPSLGVDLTGWSLFGPNGVSDNGRTVIGFGDNSGMTEAWIATIPAYCPVDYNANGFADVPDIFEFLTAWFANDARGEFDGLPGIIVADIFGFLIAWFAGCP